MVVMSLEEAAGIIDKAEAVVAAEDDALLRMNGGESLVDILTFKEHYAAIARGEPSTLKFS